MQLFPVAFAVAGFYIFLMTKKDKLLQKLRDCEGRFLWRDLSSVLKRLGFEIEQGAGSRITFVKGDLEIKLHKPHPGNEVKAYAVRQVKEFLKEEGLL